MKRPSKKFFKEAVCVVFVLTVLTGLAAGYNLGVTGLEITERAYPGENVQFKITVTNYGSENITQSVELKVYDDSDAVFDHSSYQTLNLTPGAVGYIYVNSSSFDSNYWSSRGGKLKGYDCDDHTIKVQVLGSSIDSSLDRTLSLFRTDYQIERVDISPEYPKTNEKIAITVYDEDDTEVKNAHVKVTNLESNVKWNSDDKYWEDTTNDDGQVFLVLSEESLGKTSELYATYQVDVWKSRYCKKTDAESITVTHNLTITAPEPASPRAGQSVKVRLIDESGNPVPQITVKFSGVCSSTNTQRSTAEGYVTFTPDNTGSCSLWTDGDSARAYPAASREITVSSKPGLEVKFSSDVVEVGKTITITVNSEGKAIAAASVLITPPDGVSTTGSTSDTGQLTYTPSSIGQYTVKATKDGYNEGSRAFQAKNTFRLSIPEADYKVGDTVTLNVKDSSGNPTARASVSVTGTTISGLTDDAGKFSFAINEPKEYTIVVRKDGFNDATTTVGAKCILKLKISSASVGLDENVTITVLDNTDAKTTANIDLTDPGGGKSTVQKDIYVYTPAAPGTYILLASKQGCSSIQGNFTVKTHTLTLDAKISKDNKLVVSATSRGKPVKDLKVKVKTPVGEEEITTDEEGVASLNAAEYGNYTVTVDDARYTSEPETAVKASFLKTNYRLIVAGLAILLALLLIAIIVVVYMILKGKSGGGGLRIGGKSKLG